MKILVISLVRSGSTSLSNGLSTSLDIPLINEPFDNRYSVQEQELALKRVDLLKSVVCKVIFPSFPQSLYSSYDEFYRELVNKFDIVLPLARINEEDHLLSYVNLEYLKLYSPVKSYSNYHKKYSLNMIPPSTFNELYDRTSGLMKVLRKDFLVCFNELNLDLVYYEHLFSIDRDKSYSYLKKFIPSVPQSVMEYLDVSNRYRVSNLDLKVI